jgi:Holliday junction resolvase RusA-like endonuclease
MTAEPQFLGEVVVPGAPSGLARPRLGGSHFYSPDVGGFKARVADYAHTAGLREVDSPIKLQVTILRRIPASWSKKKANAMWGKPVTTIPDLNNIVSGICDGLQGIAFHNDKQVAVIEASRTWGATDGTIIKLWGLNAT